MKFLLLSINQLCPFSPLLHLKDAISGQHQNVAGTQYQHISLHLGHGTNPLLTPLFFLPPPVVFVVRHSTGLYPTPLRLSPSSPHPFSMRRSQFLHFRPYLLNTHKGWHSPLPPSSSTLAIFRPLFEFSVFSLCSPTHLLPFSPGNIQLMANSSPQLSFLTFPSPNIAFPHWLDLFPTISLHLLLLPYYISPPDLIHICSTLTCSFT